MIIVFKNPIKKSYCCIKSFITTPANSNGKPISPPPKIAFFTFINLPFFAFLGAFGILYGIDKKIDVTTPGGFEGWLEELERYDPSVIALGRTGGEFAPMLTNWLESHYRKTIVGDWILFVKDHP